MDTHDLLYRDEVFAIQGAIFEVNRELGVGFSEAIYQECLAREFSAKSIAYVEHPELQITYKGVTLETIYKPDFICLGKIVVELEVAQESTDVHRAQVRTYLKAANLRLGLLVNFGIHSEAIIDQIIL